jgi:hypothetical protein
MFVLRHEMSGKTHNVLAILPMDHRLYLDLAAGGQSNDVVFREAATLYIHTPRQTCKNHAIRWAPGAAANERVHDGEYHRAGMNSNPTLSSL